MLAYIIFLFYNEFFYMTDYSVGRINDNTQSIHKHYYTYPESAVQNL